MWCECVSAVSFVVTDSDLKEEDVPSVKQCIHHQFTHRVWALALTWVLLHLSLIGAHPLAVHQWVQRSLHATRREAAEARATSGRVDAAMSPFRQGTGRAATAAGLPHRLLAAFRQTAACKPLLGAHRTADSLVWHAQRHQRQGAEHPKAPAGRSLCHAASTHHGSPAPAQNPLPCVWSPFASPLLSECCAAFGHFLLEQQILD